MNAAARPASIQRQAVAPALICPDWPAPGNVGAAMSTRNGGVSHAPFDSLNLRPHGQRADAFDAADAVTENQRRFAAALGVTPVFLNQVHGAAVARIGAASGSAGSALADASITTEPGVACTVLIADCLPVLFCSDEGSVVGAAHAGWRGLAAGVLENSVAALCNAAGCHPQQLLAWLGPCIGPRQFEVGADVLAAFEHDSRCFVSRPRPDGALRWLADLPALAGRRLRRAGVGRVTVSGCCTAEDPARFYSFRRDGMTGRMAAAVWLRTPGSTAATAGRTTAVERGGSR